MKGINTRNGIQVEYNLLPDECPICHYSIQPEHIGASISGSDEIRSNRNLEIILHCTRHECGRIFIGIYYRDDYPRSKSYGKWILRTVRPQEFKMPSITEEVNRISPSFKDIFGQSSAAESLGLNKIAGCGYRKALEFVVKDYCLNKNPDRINETKSMFLGTVIREFVDDQKIKLCAERAAWLGNDETHYERRWEGKDIEDVKTLIKLTCFWIESDLVTAKYTNEMPIK